MTPTEHAQRDYRTPLGTRLWCGISRDPATKEYVVTDEYVSGYYVRTRFATKRAAERYLQKLVTK